MGRPAHIEKAPKSDRPTTLKRLRGASIHHQHRKPSQALTQPHRPILGTNRRMGGSRLRNSPSASQQHSRPHRRPRRRLSRLALPPRPRSGADQPPAAHLDTDEQQAGEGSPRLREERLQPEGSRRPRSLTAEHRHYGRCRRRHQPPRFCLYRFKPGTERVTNQQQTVHSFTWFRP